MVGPQVERLRRSTTTSSRPPPNGSRLVARAGCPTSTLRTNILILQQFLCWPQAPYCAHAVLTLDKAGWHTTRKLQLPSNISLVHLPPASQELNPTETIWQYMRQSYLSIKIPALYRALKNVFIKPASHWLLWTIC
jgi:hypothetical protein